MSPGATGCHWVSLDEGGGGAPIKRSAFDIFDQHNTWVIMHDRSAQKLIDIAHQHPHRLRLRFNRTSLAS